MEKGTGQLIAIETEETRVRTLSGRASLIVAAIAIGMSLFHLYTAVFGTLEPLKQRNLHITLALVLAFLLYPSGKRASHRIHWSDIALAVASLYPCVHLFVNYSRITSRIEYFSPITLGDYISSIILCLLILEATRRVVGSSIVIVAVVVMLYGFLGKDLPGILGHRGMSLKTFIDQQVLTLGGIYSTPVAVSATYVFMFILFGAFLTETGAGQVVIDVAKAVAGHRRGGPAKIAIIASSLFGTISGSSVANVVGTGTYTIPLMKKVGYRPHFAGAVEAVASTGGQIMPPVMGAAAFVMAEVTGLSYGRIMTAAIIPAVLYYVALYMQVHLEAVKLDLATTPEAMSTLGPTLRKGAILFIPAITLATLLILGYTPMRAALTGLVVLIVVSSLKIDSRLNMKRFAAALEAGAKSSVTVATTCATAGIVIGVLTVVGLGTKFASAVTALAGNSLPLSLVLVALVALILGMGLPTTASYIIAASVAAPALVRLGLSTLAAHMFVFYYACISSITPPVAVAAYAGAGVANANPNLTGFTATKLGIAAFLVPFCFAYGPALLLEGSAAEVVSAFITALIGSCSIGVAAEGWLFRRLGWLERFGFFIGALLLAVPGITTDIPGAFLVAASYLLARRGRKQPKEHAEF